MTTKEADEIANIISTDTHQDIYFFTNLGRVFKLKVYSLPEGNRQSKGQAIINLINIEQGETVQSILTLPAEAPIKYLVMATKKGIVKKTPIEEFRNIRSNGLIAIRLKKNDQLSWVLPTSGQDHIILITHQGKAIRFKETDIRPMRRNASGVRGIRLKPGDYLVGAVSFPEKEPPKKDRRRKYFRDLLVVMEKGLGKRTPVKNFPLYKRGGQGVKAAQITPKTGPIACAHLVDQNVEQVILTSKHAQVIKLPLKNIPTLGRPTQGVILMRFAKKGDQVAAVTCLKKQP